MRTTIRSGFVAPNVSIVPTMPDEGTLNVPVAWADLCDSTASRPPIALTWRSRISRAAGSDGSAADGAAGAGAVAGA